MIEVKRRAALAPDPAEPWHWQMWRFDGELYDEGWAATQPDALTAACALAGPEGSGL